MAEKKTVKPKAEKLEKRVSPKFTFTPKEPDDDAGVKKPPKGQR